ncbi:MAG: hypothetical protein WBF13_13295 [Candidatus Zixiibacteriota bacterium]
MRGMRLLVTTILGFVFGVVCWLLASSGQPEMPAAMSWSIIFSRALLGFVIGISAWKINHMIHGIILGFIVSIPMALGALSFQGLKIFLGTLIMGMIYGFLIELITRLIVKEKEAAPETSTP